MVNLTNIVKMLLIIILLSPFLAHPSDIPAREEAINEAIPLLEQKIIKTMKEQGIPGVAVAIVSRDKVYYVKTFGVKQLGKKDKINPTTLFQIASLSKPLNATMLAILQEKGKLSLDDPVSHHLPNFHINNSRTQLKICHLISHSTGIPNNGFNELIESYAPRQNIIAKLQKTRPIASPGKQFAYNNAMYGVVEDIISNAAGKPYDVALKEELFSPLGMNHACLGLQSMLDSSDRACPHVKNNRGKYVPAEYSRGYYAFLAAGGINASLEDLIPFLQVYLGKPTNVISKETLEQLTSPYIKNNKAVMRYEAKKGVIANTYYGLGWHSMTYGNKKIIYHQGHLRGFRNFMGYLQDDVGIIILTNAEKKHASKFAVKFFDSYLSP